jgi:N6-adenosine-specific RNA methylase IME4
VNLVALSPAQETRAQAELESLIQSGRKFSTILADPPWPYETWSAKGKDRSAEKHYATSGIGKIRSFPIQQLAAPDCVALLWVTPSRLHTAVQEVIPAWQFEFKTTGFVWIKQNRKSPGLFLGMGKWTRLGSEICLLATRGKPHRQAADVRQVLMAPVGRVPSRKRFRIASSGCCLDLTLNFSPAGSVQVGLVGARRHPDDYQRHQTNKPDDGQHLRRPAVLRIHSSTRKKRSGSVQRRSEQLGSAPD